jgi:hypothetical protein
MKYLGERRFEIELVRYLKLLQRMSARDGDPSVRAWTMQLIEKVEWLIKVRGCSRHDILEHLNTCMPRDTRLVDIADETTPAARPSALAAELEPDDTGRARLPRLKRWLPWL